MNLCDRLCSRASGRAVVFEAPFKYGADWFLLSVLFLTRSITMQIDEES